MSSSLTNKVIMIPQASMLLTLKLDWGNIAAGICTVLLITVAIYCFTDPQGTSKLPLLESEIKDKRARIDLYTSQPRKTLQKGYEKFKDVAYRVDTLDGPKVILPMSMLDDLKSHPSINFKHSIDGDLMHQYTRLGGTPEIGINALKTGLNPNLSAWTPYLLETIRENLDDQLGTVTDWNPLMIYDKILRIVAASSARLFLGKDASQNQTWIDITTGYVLSAVEYAHSLKRWPPISRPLVARFLPGRKIIDQQYRSAEDIVLKALRSESKRPVGQPATALQVLYEKLSVSERENSSTHTHLQMILAVAAIHTTTATTTQALYDLAAYPEYVILLREEVIDVLSRHDGIMSKKAIGELHKLDSFMKESQRLNSPDLTTFQRKAFKPITLPTGVKLPAGTRFELPTSSIQVDPLIVGEDPYKFDGMRYLKMRQKNAESVTRHQFVSVGKTDLPWGFGRHACPGRFLAEIEVKLMLSEILLRYDIKNPAGEPRHANVEFENQVYPDTSKSILFKSVN